jgi:hypothetical protein
MTTIKLKNQRGTLVGPLHTTDSVATGDADTWADWDTTIAALSADELAKVKAIMEKYSGGSSGTTTNKLGATNTGDARSKYQGQVEHTRTVAAGYRDFWDKKNAELAASITR